MISIEIRNPTESQPIEITQLLFQSASETHIYLCPNPILISSENVRDVLVLKSNNKTIRIYPPFPVNEKTETSGAFEEVLIPEGTAQIERMVAIPSTAVRGVRMEHSTGAAAVWARAFRLDVETGADAGATLKLLIDHISQYTHQWWIRAAHNPMLGPMRMGGTITKDFRVISEFRYRGASEVEATWYGAVQCQSNLGFGNPLDRRGWLLASHHTREGMQADQGLLAFYDGMADYMSGQNHKSILSLCIATEIFLSKHSLAILKREPSKLEKLLRTTTLVDEKTRDVLGKLVIDRNHVAHGREPYVIARDPKYSLEGYVHAVRSLVGSYLKAMPLGDWPQIMDLRLQSRRRD